jgi:hypothetical protein
MPWFIEVSQYSPVFGVNSAHQWERLICKFPTAKKAAKYAATLMAEQNDGLAFRLVTDTE